MFNKLLSLYSKLKNANSHYSVWNNIYLVVGAAGLLSGAGGTLMGYLVTRISSFWDAFGWPGALALGFGSALIIALVGSFTILMIELGRFNRLRQQMPIPVAEEVPLPPAVHGASANTSVDAPPRTIANGYFSVVDLTPEQSAGIVCYFRSSVNRRSEAISVFIETNQSAGGWNLVKHRIAQYERVERGETLNIPVLSAVKRNPQRGLGFGARIGDVAQLERGFAHLLVAERRIARLIIVYSDGFQESRFFIIEWSREDGTDDRRPVITDEGPFRIIGEWERRSAEG